MDMILRGIDLVLSRKNVDTRHIHDGLIERVPLPAIIGTNTVTLLNIHTVAYTASLTPCQNLQRTRVRRIDLDTAIITDIEIVHRKTGGPVQWGFIAC
jgi:hypothetical protein